MAYTVLPLIYIEKEKFINTSELQELMAGKAQIIPSKPSTWQLKIVATPLIVINENIFSAEIHYAQFSHVMHPADALQVDILYDDTILDSVNFLNNQALETIFTLDDDHTKFDHNLKFIFSGKTDHHSYLTETHDSVTWVLKLEVWIEHLPIVPDLYGIFNDIAPSIIGNNGTTTLQIETPIYKWLIQHSNAILRACAQEVTR